MSSSSVGRGGVVENGTSLGDRVLDAIAEKEETSPAEFDQLLSESIDPDTLERVFRDEDRDGRVTFSYLGYRIEVRADGQVSVNDR